MFSKPASQRGPAECKWIIQLEKKNIPGHRVSPYKVKNNSFSWLKHSLYFSIHGYFLRDREKMFSGKFTAFDLVGFLRTTSSLCRTDAEGAGPACTCGFGGYVSFSPLQFLQTTWNPTLELSGSISARKKGFSPFSQHTSSGVRAAMSIVVGTLAGSSVNYCLTEICMNQGLLVYTHGCASKLWFLKRIRERFHHLAYVDARKGKW